MPRYSRKDIIETRTFILNDVQIRCYALQNGHREIDEDDMHHYLDISGDFDNLDALQMFQWLREETR